MTLNSLRSNYDPTTTPQVWLRPSFSSVGLQDEDSNSSQGVLTATETQRSPNYSPTTRTRKFTGCRWSPPSTHSGRSHRVESKAPLEVPNLPNRGSETKEENIVFCRLTATKELVFDPIQNLLRRFAESHGSNSASTSIGSRRRRNGKRHRRTLGRSESKHHGDLDSQTREEPRDVPEWTVQPVGRSFTAPGSVGSDDPSGGCLDYREPTP